MSQRRRTSGATGKDNDAMIKLMFLRLDPLLRMLCEAVQTLKSTRPPSHSVDRERYMGLLRTTVELVDELHAQLQRLSCSVPRELQASVADAVLVMLDYILLPVLGILRTLGPGAWGADGPDETEGAAVDLVIQSARWKCIEHASRILPTLLQLLPAKEPRTTNIPAAKRNMYCTACVMALPAAASILSSARRLDHGESCLGALLTTIQDLVQYDNDLHPGTPCVMRLLDASMALVESSATSASLQGIAVDTIQTLMATSTRSSTLVEWKSVFPGVYSGLYRRILTSLRVSHAQARAQALVPPCVAALVRLLQCSLPPHDPQSLPALASDAAAALSKLRALSAAHATSAATASTEQQQEEDEDPFVSQVRRRLPASLMVLVQSLMVARSDRIRAALVPLARVILIESRWCWLPQSPTSHLIRTTLESSMVLTSDAVEAVASAAHELITEYFAAHEADVSTVVGPRIVELVERLPLLVQSARETELSACLRLIRGYLQLPQPRLRSSLTAESVILTLRRALITILDVQFEMLDEHQSGTIVLSFVNSESSALTASSRVHYISESAKELAVSMVQALGAVLGPYHVTIMVDACVAELYRSSLDRMHRRVALDGRSQIYWIHEWIGAVPLMQELLNGGFAAIEDAPRRRKYVQRYLSPLMKTILPIITTYPLWEIPSSIAPSFHDEGSSNHAVVAAAFRGNVAMTCALLRFCGAVGTLLGKDVAMFLPLMLYPILEKAGECHAGVVREAAYHALQSLAKACGYPDVVTLMAKNMESSLVGPMLSRLRVPGGRSLVQHSDIDDETFRVLGCGATVLRILTESVKKREPVLSHSACNPLELSLAEELTIQLTTRFDYSATRMPNDVEASLCFIQLFDAAIQLLHVSWQLRSCEELRSSQTVPMESEPWFQLLDAYKNDSDDKLSPREGFEKHFKEKEAIVVNEEERVVTDTEKSLVRDTAFCSRLASRLGYLLSHPDLKVQVRSCEVLEQCFQFLGGIAIEESIQSSISNGPKTAVLRQVHALWPAISARWNSLCSAVIDRPLQRTSLIVFPQESARPSRSENFGEQRVYLSKLLSLISVMVECADDFMASRFREVIWPWVAKIVRSLTSQAAQPGAIPLRIGTPSASAAVTRSTPRKSMTESDSLLLYTTIDCLRRVYHHRQVGMILSGLIPTVGMLLLPLLDHEMEPIALVGTEALRSALRIDCDALWRPIMELAGCKIPQCPLNHVPRTVENPSMTVNSSKRLQGRAKELLEFIDTLPEQPL